MVAVACKTVVYTFDIPSRSCLGPLPVPDGRLLHPIWTHDEYLRFAIIHPGSITIWEVEFTLKLPPTQLESFSIPAEVVDGDEFLFLPFSIGSPSPSKIQSKSGISRLPSFFSSQSRPPIPTQNIRSPPTVVSSYLHSIIGESTFGRSHPLATHFISNPPSSSTT